MNIIGNRKALAAAVTFALASTAALAQDPRIVSVVVMDDLDAFVVLGENLQQSVARSRITLGDVGDITRHCMRSRGPDGLTMMTCTLPGGLPPAGDYMLTIEHFTNNGVTQSDYGLTIGAVGPRGATGQDGARGPAGAQGTAGAAGATGPQGPQGAAGDAGAPGQPGLPGQDGATGPAGAQGERGLSGPQGETGAQGVAGIAGPQGERGVDGATGATGATGQQGDAGPAGAQGERGLDGATGATGAQGERGSDGATGATGAQGERGVDGATGPQGVAGIAGPQGERGLPGQNGQDGATGPQGVAGAPGVQGLPGTIGATGATGPAGPVGPMGPQGPVGAAGLSNMRFVTSTITIPARELRRGVAQCASNEIAFNGGMYVANHGGSSFDLSNVDGIYVNTSGVGGTARDWVVIATNVRNFSSQNVTFWMACAQNGTAPAAASANQAVTRWNVDGAKLAE
ncbi:MULTISPECIES: collagen-like protein [unclassified Luteimonas]|uniref:collagen-like protein n=1 Tax=unclassified Luteimonas TaxID=2629088 RepID=UPI0016049CEB|nr:MULTISPECIES: collagen-like protein [unclassified Luteimonas]MBB1473024.1 collagen-like protein [Luteimonas sp. MC1782]MBB6598275.1 collagen-like protein [Luteimonas sp. MC1825]QOC88488.1 collagen-like protein [Luteimonas sp. MC1825]